MCRCCLRGFWEHNASVALALLCGNFLSKLPHGTPFSLCSYTCTYIICHHVGFPRISDQLFLRKRRPTLTIPLTQPVRQSQLQRVDFVFNHQTSVACQHCIKQGCLSHRVGCGYQACFTNKKIPNSGLIQRAFEEVMKAPSILVRKHS